MQFFLYLSKAALLRTYPAAQFPLTVPPFSLHSVEVKHVPFRGFDLKIRYKWDQHDKISSMQIIYKNMYEITLLHFGWHIHHLEMKQYWTMKTLQKIHRCKLIEWYLKLNQSCTVLLIFPGIKWFGYFLFLQSSYMGELLSIR